MAHIHKSVVIEDFAFRPCKAPPEQAIHCNREDFNQSRLGKECKEWNQKERETTYVNW